MTATVIPLHALFPHQDRVALSPARFKVIRWGRRTGKDRFAIHVSVVGHGPETCPGAPLCARAPHPGLPCFPGLVHGLDVVWLAPDFPQANMIWAEEIEPRFSGRDGIEVNQSERTVRIGDRGTLWLRTAQNPDATRGAGARLGGVVVNEAAHLDLGYLWRQVLRPALMDNRGWAIIASTTNRGLDGNAERLTPSFFNRRCAEIRAGQHGPEWAEFHATARDNPKIVPAELEALIAEYAPDSAELAEEVEAKLLESDAGLVFSEWREDLHVVPATFQAPPNWRFAATVDFGYTAPGWLGIFGLGAEHEVVGLEEVNFRELHAYEAGRRCGDACRRYAVEYVACDSAMNQRTGLGPTVLEEFQRGMDDAYGGRGRAPRLIEASKGPGSRVARVQLMHRYLSFRVAEDGTIPPWYRPRLAFRAGCTTAIRTIPKLTYDPRRPEDVDTTLEDHAYDATGYLLMSRPPLAHAWEAPRDEHTHPGFDYDQRRRRVQPADTRGAIAPPTRFVPRGPMQPLGDL